MSKILAEQLLAGVILADNDNEEYIYLPGGEVGRTTRTACLNATANAAATCRWKKQSSLPNACTLHREGTRSWGIGRGERK